VRSSENRTIKPWDAGTGQNLLTLRGHTDDLRSVAFSPDGNASQNGTVKFWDTDAR